MGERPVLTARLSERTLERLEEYSDREGMSKSKAADNMIRQGLDVQESDMRLVPVKSDGGTVIEDELEHTQDQIQETKSEVDSLSREIQDFKSTTAKMLPSFFVSFLWIGFSSAFEFSNFVTAGTGIAVIAFLLASYYRVIKR